MFKEHLNVLYNQTEKTDYDPTILKQLDRIEPEPNLGIPPDIKEIRRAISKMQYEKAP